MQEEMIWLAEKNPVLVSEYQKIPLAEYYAILDKKIAEVEAARKQQQNNPKTKRRR